VTQVVRNEFVEADQIGVTDVGERPKFLLEEVERRGIEVQQCLERDPLAALPVEGLVNNAHAARSKAADDLVADRPNPVSWLRDHASIQRTLFLDDLGRKLAPGTRAQPALARRRKVSFAARPRRSSSGVRRERSAGNR